MRGRLRGGSAGKGPPFAGPVQGLMAPQLCCWLCRRGCAEAGRGAWGRFSARWAGAPAWIPMANVKRLQRHKSVPL